MSPCPSAFAATAAGRTPATGASDGKVVVTAFLGQVGGREIDGDALGGEGEARGDQRRPHPVARLGDRFVAKTDQVEGRQPGRDLDLHVHWPCLDPFECNGGDVLNHGLPPRAQFSRAGSMHQEQ